MILIIGIIAIIGVVLLVTIAKKPKLAVYMYFLLACILPAYFGIEVSESLPLLTVTRMLIILLGIYAVIHKKREGFWGIIQRQKVTSILSIYFVFRIGAELYFITKIPNYVIKELFTIVVEQFIVTYLITRIVNTEKMFYRCFKLFVYGSIVIMLVGIIQSLTGVNLAYYLNTVNRTMLQTNGFRLGFTRAEASFGHPVYFGEFCVLVMPFISYAYDTTKNRKYLIFLFIDIIALALSNSRGAILPGMIILVLMIARKTQKVKWRYIGAGIIGLLVVGFVSTIVPSIGNTLSTMFESILNVFGGNYDLGDLYGGNVNGLDSRTSQLTGITWTIMQGAALFGFGPDAHMRGFANYYFNNRWNNLQTIDVGYVGFFLCEGLIGTIGQMVLIFGLIFKAYKKSEWKNIYNLNNAFFYCFLAYAILLLSATGLGLTYWTIISMFITYNNIRERQEIINV